MVISKSKFIFIVLFWFNLIVSFLTPLFLPEKYFFDSKLIVNDTFNEIGWVGSYPFAIMFYKLTGLRYLPYFLVALIQVPIINYIIYKIGVPKDFHIFNLRNLLMYIALFLSALFISMPSKEFITFILISIIPFIFLSKKTDKFKIISSLVLVASFSFFRIYYVLIPILAIGMYLVTFVKFKKRIVSTIFYGLILTFFISLSHGIIKGQYISQATREDYVMGKNNNFKVNSSIHSPIAQDTWYGEAVGIFYGFLAVNVPVIEGFKNLLSPQVITFVIWQLLVFYVLIVRLKSSLYNKGDSQLKLWALLILFSYFMIQGVFEPDLGTSVRHKMGFLPLIYFVFYYDSIRKKI